MEENDGGEEEKLPYVHVRARRGQATDSHSLAERVKTTTPSPGFVNTPVIDSLQSQGSVELNRGRVFDPLLPRSSQARREKINARMKLLQELVPGCSKVSLSLSLMKRLEKCWAALPGGPR